ncbi:MAG: MFS transporter [Kineosporiaceae bacterium]
MSAPPGQSVRPSARRLHLMAAASGVAFGLTAPLTVVYATALGAGGVLAGLAVSCMSVSILLLDVLGTRWTPRLEPQRALTVALLVFGAGSLISAAAPNLAVMIAARCLQGIGAALFQGTGPMLAVRIARPGHEGRALGQFQASWFLGIALGPLAGAGLAGLIDGTAGLRLAFACCAGVSLLAASAVPLLIPRMPTGLRPVIGLPRLDSMRGRRPRFGLGVATCGQAMRSGLAMTLVPLVATSVLGLHGLHLGIMLSVLAVTDVAAMFLAGRLGDRFGRLPVLASALGIGSLALLLAPVITGDVLFVLLCMGVGIAVGTTWVVPAAMAVDLAGSAETGLSAYRIAADVGLGLGGVLAGLAVAEVGVRDALTVGAVVLALPLGLALLVGETNPRRRRAALVPAPATPSRPAFTPGLDPHAPVASSIPLTTATADPAAGSLPGTPHHPPTELASSPPPGGPAVSVPTPPTPPDDLPAQPPALPTVEDFRRLAADQGLAFADSRYEAALAVHAGLRPALLRLRQQPLPFTGGAEPGTALVWLEKGGEAA